LVFVKSILICYKGNPRNPEKQGGTEELRRERWEASSMNPKHTEPAGGHPKFRKQSEFIANLCASVREGSTQELQEVALLFWRKYPQISLTFARRVLLALERLDVPAQRFESSLLAVLARCYLRSGKAEQAYEYVVAAQRIMPPDAPQALVCQVGELEVTACLACSKLAAAQDAYQRLEDYAQAVCGGLNSAQLCRGARLSLAAGDLPQASARAHRAMERAVTDEQRCQAQLSALKIEECRDGDIRRELIQLVALEHSLRMKVRSPLSAETRVQLLCRLSHAFLCQGKLNQAAQRLRKIDLRRGGASCAPEFLAAALAIANEHFTEARRHLELFECQSSVELCQTEYLGQRFKLLMLYQMIDGAKQGLDEAEEFYRLCEATQHPLLRQVACLLFSSSLIAAGDQKRAERLLQESELQTTRHKTLRLLHGCLFALCTVDDAVVTMGITGLSLGDLIDLFSDEDTSFALLFLAHAQPAFLKLLLAQGMEGALSSSAQQLLEARLAYARSLLAERGSGPDQPARTLNKASCAEFEIVSSDQILIPSLNPWDPAFISDSALEGGHALRIQLFGGLQVRRRGIRLDLERLRRNKVRSLITILALARGKEVSRSVIVERLWPQQENEHSLNSFYVAWSALKAAFLTEGPKLPARLCSPELFPFSSAGGRCVLLTEYCGLDLDDFDRLVLRIKDAIYRGQDERCFRFADELLSLYQGEVLPADGESDELYQARLHYQKAFVEMMLLVARRALTRRQTALALPFIERGLTADSSCEELYRLAMHTYALEGRRDDSLRSYYRCRRNLAQELGIEPSPELTELFIRLISMSSQTDYSAAELQKRLEAADKPERELVSVS